MIAEKTASPKFISRIELEKIFPHQGHDLIGDYGVIKKESCDYVLQPERFHYYTGGHPWYFPMHWLVEMAAQAAGLMAIHLLKQELGDEEASEYCIPSFLQPGRWSKRPLSPDLSLYVPIVATVLREDMDIKITKRLVEYRASVNLSHDKKEARLCELFVVICKKNFCNNS